jgi:nucleotide-binding universal stress UspA family protein
MAQHSHLLVGYDGTTQSELALKWAAEEAGRRRLALAIGHAWRWPYPIAHKDHRGMTVAQRLGGNLLRHGARLAEELAPGVPVREKLLDGPAADALLGEAADAELVVVGSPEGARLGSGSPAVQVPARSPRPTVVVRDPGSGTEGRVVVGVDGSAAAEAALEFAIEQAALRGWQVDAVFGAWQPSALADTEMALCADRVELARVCEAKLRSCIELWQEKYPSVEVRASVVLKEPCNALLSAVKGADLVVVGDRGDRGLHPHLLGATTLTMLRASPCSVAVVHP